MGKDPNADTDTGPAPQFDTEPANELGELKPWPIDEVVTEDLHKPATHLEDTGNDKAKQSVEPDDLPEVDMDHPRRVIFGKELRGALTLLEVCRTQSKDR